MVVSPSSILLGPPDLNNAVPTSPPSDLTTSTPSDLTTSSTKCLTENSSPTFLSTGNPCLDFFFHIVPDTPPESIVERLQLSYPYNPLTTLKLICHLRGVRGTGKFDKERFYITALWLHEKHPKTLACNVRWFGEFGYLKDLPEILYRVVQGPDVRTKEDVQRARCPISWERGKRKHRKENSHEWRKGQQVLVEKKARFVLGNETGPKLPRIKKPTSPGPKKPTLQDFILQKMKAMNVEGKSDRKVRKQKEKKEKKEKNEDEDIMHTLIPRKKKAMVMAKKALLRYAEDLKYRFLHDCISHLFAELLTSDLKSLKSGETSKISLASKWCPSLNSSYDRATLICESIARRVFPRNSDPEFEGIEKAHYAYRVRDRLRKQVLVPLRKALELPELYMSSGDWGLLPYNRVPSVAMKIYKSFFYTHDRDRFSEFLDEVEKGEAKIAAGALLPHEIVESVRDKGKESRVGELQWKRMVEDMLKEGKFKNCIAVCDVSGSMSGMPMKVCVALGLLLSELSEKPWKGKLITFSSNPKFHKIKGKTLLKKKRFVEQMDWGMNTDFQKVFDKILQLAVGGKLSADQMIKRVFVFSDMEFDEASENSWETDYEAIQRKFEEKGYGSVVPEIVFWNLRDSKATPVTETQNGVALVSGYSKNLMKLFLQADGAINPKFVMEQAISGEEYQNLVVFD